MSDAMSNDAMSDADATTEPTSIGIDPALLSQEIGQRLRWFRKVRGLSQAQLASRIGVSFQQVQKYENGRNRISVPSLLVIARALEVDAAEFLLSQALADEPRGAPAPINHPMEPVDTSLPRSKKSKKSLSRNEMVANLLQYFDEIATDEMRHEIITHAKRLAGLK